MSLGAKFGDAELYFANEANQNFTNIVNWLSVNVNNFINLVKGNYSMTPIDIDEIIINYIKINLFNSMDKSLYVEAFLLIRKQAFIIISDAHLHDNLFKE